MIKTAISAIAIATFAAGLQAQAECRNGNSGYVYVHVTCTQDPVTNVRNICQSQRGDTENKSKAVLLISNVIYDEVGNSRFPSSQFFDELQIQYDLTLSGKVSYCYEDYDKAVDAMRKQIADWKRLFKDTAVIKQVYMDNS